jgi:general secretion pathway protein G
MEKRSVRKSEHRVWSSSSRSRGLTLVELLVTLVVLSILAGVAMPYAEIAIRREKEFELRHALREIRSAIDAFHDEWKSGEISKTAEGVSDDGFPKTLMFLVDGVDAGDAKGSKRRYLRRVPRDPFADASRPTSEQWSVRAYQDDPGALSTGGRDVYDVRSLSNGDALDGTKYKDW